MANELTVLLVGERSERSRALAQALLDSGYRVLASVQSGAGVYAAFTRHHPDLVVVDIDTPDRETLEELRTISERDPRPIALFTSDDDRATIQRAVQCGVSAYVVDTTGTRRVRPVLDAAMARFEQYQSMRGELAVAKNSLAERKLIDQAKGILMKRKGVDEATAYRTLQKMAMNRNTRLAELARSIITAADLLA